MEQDKVPGRIWYFVSLVVAVAGCTGGSLMVLHAAMSIGNVEQFLAPGSHTIQVAEPGNYTLWNDYKAVFKGRSYAVGKSLPNGVDFRVAGPEGELLVAGGGSKTMTLGETERVAVASFSTPAPGEYKIVIEGRFPVRVFSVGPDNFFRDMGMVFGGAGVVLLGLGAAAALAVWAYFKRTASNVQVETDGGATMSPVEKSPEQAAVQVTTIVYALQAASFMVGITFLAAVIVNYIKRDDVAGTWLESHFRWQINTFWWSLLWAIVGMLLMMVFIGIFVIIADAIWVLYRIVKGWLNLNDGKPMD